MKSKKTLNMVTIAAFTAAMTMVTAFASTDNPLTGDEQGRYIWVVMAVAAVAFVVVIVITAVSSKKRK